MSSSASFAFFLVYLIFSVLPRHFLVTPGYAAGVGLVAALVYNFLGTHSRQERLNTAIAAWFAAMVLIYAVQGGFI